ncbi:MAG: hypothetical protein GY754_42690 [bacterium]|nr:hypothetical protein [bacterium]
MATADFDKYFLQLPPFDREDNFDSFWLKSIAELKKIPIEPVLNKNRKKTSSKFVVFNVSFRGFMKSQVTGELLVPKKQKKPKVIIDIHDYNSRSGYSQQILNETTAYLFLTLRGHDILPKEEDIEAGSPGYLIENIYDLDTYYAKAVFLDVLRAIDMLRLVQELNCGSIGVIGKGFGAAAAIFAASFSDRITALVLDTPSFCHLSVSQNISTSDAANEINEFIAAKRGKKKQIKTNLSYFDALNFGDKIRIPVLATVGFKDTLAPPECIFGLFNNLLCEKILEVYPDGGHEAGGQKQYQKSIKWLVEQIETE